MRLEFIAHLLRHGKRPTRPGHALATPCTPGEASDATHAHRRQAKPWARERSVIGFRAPSAVRSSACPRPHCLPSTAPASCPIVLDFRRPTAHPVAPSAEGAWRSGARAGRGRAVRRALRQRVPEIRALSAGERLWSRSGHTYGNVSQRFCINSAQSAARRACFAWHATHTSRWCVCACTCKRADTRAQMAQDSFREKCLDTCAPAATSSAHRAITHRLERPAATADPRTRPGTAGSGAAGA